MFRVFLKISILLMLIFIIEGKFLTNYSEAAEADKIVFRSHNVTHPYSIDNNSSALILYTAPSSTKIDVPGLYIATKDGVSEVLFKDNNKTSYDSGKCPDPDIISPHPKAPDSMFMYKDRVYLWMTNPASCVPWMTGPIENRPDYTAVYPDSDCQKFVPPGVYKPLGIEDKGEFVWKCQLDFTTIRNACTALPSVLFDGNWTIGFEMNETKGNYHIVHNLIPVGTHINRENYPIADYGTNPLILYNNNFFGALKFLINDIPNSNWYWDFKAIFFEADYRRTYIDLDLMHNNYGTYKWIDTIITRASEPLLQMKHDFEKSLPLGRYTKIGEIFYDWHNMPCEYIYNYENNTRDFVCDESGFVGYLPPMKYILKNSDPEIIRTEEEIKNLMQAAGFETRTDADGCIFVPVFSREKTAFDCTP